MNNSQVRLKLQTYEDQAQPLYLAHYTTQDGKLLITGPIPLTPTVSQFCDRLISQGLEKECLIDLHGNFCDIGNRVGTVHFSVNEGNKLCVCTSEGEESSAHFFGPRMDGNFVKSA